MKFIILSAICLLSASSMAAKLDGFSRPVVRLLRDDSIAPVGANYRTAFELDNGIRVEEVGSEGSVGQTVVRGSYSFITPEGQTITINYIADENGYRAEGAAIPVAPPMPAHALAQIRFAEEQAARKRSN